MPELSGHRKAEPGARDRRGKRQRRAAGDARRRVRRVRGPGTRAVPAAQRSPGLLLELLRQGTRAGLTATIDRRRTSAPPSGGASALADRLRYDGAFPAAEVRVATPCPSSPSSAPSGATKGRAAWSTT